MRALPRPTLPAATRAALETHMLALAAQRRAVLPASSNGHLPQPAPRRARPMLPHCSPACCARLATMVRSHVPGCAWPLWRSPWCWSACSAQARLRPPARLCGRFGHRTSRRHRRCLPQRPSRSMDRSSRSRRDAGLLTVWRSSLMGRRRYRARLSWEQSRMSVGSFRPTRRSWLEQSRWILQRPHQPVRPLHRLLLRQMSRRRRYPCNRPAPSLIPPTRRASRISLVSLVKRREKAKTTRAAAVWAATLLARRQANWMYFRPVYRST